MSRPLAEPALTPWLVIVTDHPFGTGLDPEREVLARFGATIALAPSSDEETLSDLARRADALLVCYAKITKPVIEAAASGGCRIVARYGIGVDNIDVAEATRAGILVTNVPDYCIDEVADHTLALLLAAERAIVSSSSDVREGKWERPAFTPRRLRGRAIAVIGLGRIGRAVAERSRAFGLRVRGFDPYVSEHEVPGVDLVRSCEAAFATADYISLHVPLTDETHHLINAESIGSMKQAPVIVNTSRGGLIELEAVAQALGDHRIAAIALDVTDPEPLPHHHPLRSHPRAIITPHIAYYSVEAQTELQRRAAEEVVRALSDERPRSVVNAEVL